LKLDLIVARYKEDVAWTKEASDMGYNVIVYNKFEGENLLPNVGRESHTYLHHIIENWDNLADITVFVQGNPFEHSTDFFVQLQLVKEEPAHFRPIMSINGDRMAIIQCDWNAQPHGVVDGKPIPLGLHYEWLTQMSSPRTFACTPGAQFAVSHESIRRWTKKFYERAILSVSYDINPIEGHSFERSWPVIFGARQNLPVSISYRGSESSFSSMGMTPPEYLREKFSKGEFMGELHESYRSI